MSNEKKKTRVAAFIDGFNVYHAIDEMKAARHLLWVDLHKVITAFIDPNLHELTAVWYFSAWAKHRPISYNRQVEYVKALYTTGIRPVMGNFKDKDKKCPSCKHEWVGHEEKESDVNFAVHLLREAHKKNFDEAFLVTRDSDLVPAVKMTRELYPGLTFKIIAPPERMHSKELAQIADKRAAISRVHLERALFPAQLLDDRDGRVIARRPKEYDPP